MHIWKCIKMHWCASKCISVHQNASNVCRMNCSNVMCTNWSKKWFLFHLIRVKCINMHLNASKCIIMYAEWIILMFCAWNFNLKNSNFFGWKWPIFFLSAQNASICIRMHQNVCRMKCANVLCTKISKNGFILHLKGLKSAKYLLHFVMEDPVLPVLHINDPPLPYRVLFYTAFIWYPKYPNIWIYPDTSK